MGVPLSAAEVERTRAAIERHRHPDGSPNVSAIASELGLTRSSVQSRLRGLGRPTSPPGVEGSPPDPIDRRRTDDVIASLRRQLAEAERRAAKAESIREAALGLAGSIEPVSFDLPPDRRHEAAETIVVMLSDLHWGEVIDLARMDGLNSYNVPIARARLRRAFEAIVKLGTRHWAGPPPARVILILGGDLVSGEIHLELAKTNELMALPAVRDVVAHLAAGIELLRRSLDCPIDIISVPGNHGRISEKPESKLYAAMSYDILVADLLELRLGDLDGLSFFSPASGDALFRVSGWQFLATHGDRIGSRGGTGFVGPAATAARGFKRAVADYSARGVHLDTVLAGHFHSALQLEEGFVNGSLPGPSEYGRDARFRPRPACQLFLSVHPSRGVTQIRWLQVGDPSEGSIYAGREPTPEKPRYRIQAIGQRA